jgi:hypothetical protein
MKEMKKLYNNNKTKSWFLEKINQIDKPLSNLIKMRKGNTQLVKSEMKKGR